MNQIKLFFITVTLIFINSSISFSSDTYNWKLYSKNSKAKIYYDDFAKAHSSWYYPIEGNYKYHLRIDSILLPILFKYNETQTNVSKKIRYTHLVLFKKFRCSDSYNHFIHSGTYFSSSIAPLFKNDEGLASYEHVGYEAFKENFTLETDKETKKIVKKICKDFYPNGGKVYEVNKDKIYKKIENLNDIKNRTLVTSSDELEFKFFKDTVEIKETYGFFSKKVFKFEIKEDGYIYIDPIKIDDDITLNYALGFNSNGKIILWEKINNEKYITTNLIFEDNRVSTPTSERKSYANLIIDRSDGKSSMEFKENKIVVFRDKLNYYYSTYSFSGEQLHFTARNNNGEIKDYAIELDSNANDYHIWTVFLKDPNEQNWEYYNKNWRNGDYGKNIIKIGSKIIYR